MRIFLQQAYMYVPDVDAVFVDFVCETSDMGLGLTDKLDYSNFHLFFNNFCFNLNINNLT